MNTVRTVETGCSRTELTVGVNPKLSELSAFLSEWLEQNSEVINRQFGYAVSEAAKNFSDTDEIATKFVYELVTQGLAYVAEAERESALQRQAEGIKAAKERGVHFGRQKIEIPTEFYPLYFRYKKGEVSARKCGEMLNISHTTFLKWIKEIDKKEENL